MGVVDAMGTTRAGSWSTLVLSGSAARTVFQILVARALHTGIPPDIHIFTS